MPNVKRLHVNGTARAVDADPERPLLSVLRDDLQLTGSRYGCGEGQCGACTVLLDGQAVRSCITPTGSVRDRAITTIEGLAHGEKLHPLQEAFLESGASLQCGYCASGMLMSAAALLRHTPHPTEDQIRHALQGNLCRCGTYTRIVDAVSRAAKSGAAKAAKAAKEAHR